MAPSPPLAVAADAPAIKAPSFSVRRSQDGLAYHQLSLEDDRGCIANWVIPMPLKSLNKKSVLLWLMSAPPASDSLACVESGPVRQVPARNGATPDMRTKMAQGLLQLNFSGHWLSGYHRLRCLPEGNGQLWQLTPIS